MNNLLKVEKKNLNYFFSVCTLNLGVVPWIRSAAFRFCPIFFSLLLLLFLVTLVRETIYILPIYLKNSLNLLPKLRSSVKILLIFYIITAPYITYASSHYLSIGEHLSISLKNGEKFIIGNKEIITGKIIQNGKNLLIKAKHLGLSEIIVINSKHKRSIKIVVINKIFQEKLYYLKKQIILLGLQPAISARIITVSGYLKSKVNFKLLVKLIKKHSLIQIQKIQLSSKLKKIILSQIYLDFYNEYIDNLECRFNDNQLNCIISKGNIKSPLVSYYQNLYNVKFIPTQVFIQNKNHTISLNLIQIESSSLKNLSWGLQSLKIPLANLVQSNWKTILEQEISLNNNDTNLSLLAKPSIQIVENEEAIIKLGTELPFQENNRNGATTIKWKFIGFKLKVKIIKKNNNFLLYYQTEFKRPTTINSTSGGFEKSVIIISKNSTNKLFEINYESTNLNHNSFPGLSKLPLLGKLFISSNKTKTYKKIIGLITIK